MKLSEQQINYLLTNLRDVVDCPMENIYKILRSDKIPEHPEILKLRTELVKATTKIRQLNSYINSTYGINKEQINL
jgi:hypothetical protein